MNLDNDEMEQIVGKVAASRHLTRLESKIMEALSGCHPTSLDCKELAFAAGSTEGSIRVIICGIRNRIEGTGLRVNGRRGTGYWLGYQP